MTPVVMNLRPGPRHGRVAGQHPGWRSAWCNRIYVWRCVFHDNRAHEPGIAREIVAGPGIGLLRAEIPTAYRRVADVAAMRRRSCSRRRGDGSTCASRTHAGIPGPHASHGARRGHSWVAPRRIAERSFSGRAVRCILGSGRKGRTAARRPSGWLRARVRCLSTNLIEPRRIRLYRRPRCAVPR